MSSLQVVLGSSALWPQASTSAGLNDHRKSARNNTVSPITDGGERASSGPGYRKAVESCPRNTSIRV